MTLKHKKGEKHTCYFNWVSQIWKNNQKMKPLFSQYKLKKKEFNKLFLAIVDTQQESVFWILPWAKQWYGQWREPYYLFLLIEKNQTMIKKKKVNLLVYYTVSPFNKHVFFFWQACFNKPILHKNYKLYQKRPKKKKQVLKKLVPVINEVYWLCLQVQQALQL